MIKKEWTGIKIFSTKKIVFQGVRPIGADLNMPPKNRNFYCFQISI